MEIKWVETSFHGDDRGKLSVMETGKNIPFDVKRVYYIYDTEKEVRRGFHAHKSLSQVLLCVNGSCKIMLDDGHERCDVTLDSPEKGIIIENNVWREMYDFSDQAVLLVLASELYDESDYIRDYDEFLKLTSKGEI